METLVLDPNLAYVVLLVGLWLAVTAVYMPGTGFFEVIAFAMLVGALVLLTQLPTNWVALLAVMIGALGFILMPFFSFKHAPVAILGLGLQTIGGLFLFNGPGVSPLILGFTVLVAFAYHQMVLLPTLKRVQAQSDRPVDREDQMIGLRGRVTSAIDPVGAVQVDSELWSATSHEAIEVGTPIVVVGREGLQLLVEPLKRKDETEG